MDHTLRRLGRVFNADPFDIGAAQQYIAALERTIEGKPLDESPYEKDYDVMRYVPIPGEITDRDLAILQEYATFFEIDYGEMNEDSFIVSTNTLLFEFGASRHLHKVGKRAKAQGYNYVVMMCDPDIHYSSNFRRRLAARGLEGTLSGLRKEAAQLKDELKTWYPEQPPETYSDYDIRQLPLFRFLTLPHGRSIGFPEANAITKAREIIHQLWEKKRSG